jgi:hypothetical protein
LLNLFNVFFYPVLLWFVSGVLQLFPTALLLLRLL